MAASTTMAVPHHRSCISSTSPSSMAKATLCPSSIAASNTSATNA
uniref:Uncharacterized protein n=1 Tax=Arundo donax TaxID=35708 RepID=A0A0A9H5P9_ARUDO